MDINLLQRYLYQLRIELVCISAILHGLRTMEQVAGRCLAFTYFKNILIISVPVRIDYFDNYVCFLSS